MTIRIEQMNLDNLNELFEFEAENKTFFERTLPPRPKAYAEYESFKSLMLEMLDEWIDGYLYMKSR